MLRFPCLGGLLIVSLLAGIVRGEGEWETTRESERALARGLEWLAHAENQGREGNWESNDLGLVSLGALAFMADGHRPGQSHHGLACKRALDYVLRKARRESGLLNIADPQRDLYNHGLSTFVLGQAYGMYRDEQIGGTLDRALRLIAMTQCRDGGWDYRARSQERGHDLSLAVMQAKALRSAVDSGFDVPREVIDQAIKSVREHHTPKGASHNAPEDEQRKRPGQFTYTKGGGGGTVAMAAAGVVCLQEFGQYDDWRIAKNMDYIAEQVKKVERRRRRGSGQVPFDAYTLYYVGQALYQVGGRHWRECYPILRDQLVTMQINDTKDPKRNGSWQDGGRVGGKPGELFGTAVACFILAIPNRYLPILQEGKIESFSDQSKKEP
ncbi:MAG: squalene--hopene cyclase [Pirellulales bacterium]